MFGRDENINNVEALIPTETEMFLVEINSSDLEESNEISEWFIAECEFRYIWKESLGWV